MGEGKERENIAVNLVELPNEEGELKPEPGERWPYFVYELEINTSSEAIPFVDIENACELKVEMTHHFSNPRGGRRP